MTAFAVGAVYFTGNRNGPAPPTGGIASEGTPATPGDALPSSAADAQTGLFETLPGTDASGIGAYLANAEQQLREGHLIQVCFVS